MRGKERDGKRSMGKEGKKRREEESQEMRGGRDEKR